MTDKQIIKLKPTEDLNEKIIKEKGNTKCIFYSDDICRKGDKTRDCVNCARVEYHSLYSLNWDNQERLQKIIKQKEQELQKAMDNYVQLDLQRVKEYNELVDLYKAKEQECEELKKAIDGLLKIQYQLADSCTKYEQTLIEIQQDLEFATYCESQECGCDDANECLECTKKQILQKISECEANQ